MTLSNEVPGGTVMAKPIHFSMPPFGLAAAHGVVPVARRGETGAERLAYGTPAAAAAGLPSGE